MISIQHTFFLRCMLNIMDASCKMNLQEGPLVLLLHAVAGRENLNELCKLVRMIFVVNNKEIAILQTFQLRLRFANTAGGQDLLIQEVELLVNQLQLALGRLLLKDDVGVVVVVVSDVLQIVDPSREHRTLSHRNGVELRGATIGTQLTRVRGGQVNLHRPAVVASGLAGTVELRLPAALELVDTVVPAVALASGGVAGKTSVLAIFVKSDLTVTKLNVLDAIHVCENLEFLRKNERVRL